MIKQMAWNTFKNTGDINTYLELVKVKDIEKYVNEENNGDNKNEWNNNTRK